MWAKRIRNAPQIAAAMLCAAVLSDVSVFPEPMPISRIVFLGDSLTAGAIVGGKPPAFETAFPAVIAAKLREAGKNVAVANAGIPGDTSRGALERLDSVLKERVDILVIELGVNDYSAQPPAATNDNLRAIIRRTRERYPRAVIVLIRLAPLIAESKDAPTLTQLAREENVHYVQHFFRGVSGRPELLQEDYFHPNAAGQRVLAENLWLILEPLIRDL